MAICYDCIHRDVCRDAYTISNCECFKNKADYVEVKYGEWTHTVEKGHVYNHHYYNCSLCGASAFTSGYEKYCHNCGAKMDAKKDGV